ncbi:uncharacterized protein LOC115878087 [Sitophilus oryzae]|uniref:Uncharacterized protein LOC115878087 n=1 Tax=Sitophilus oryzae TaxID=7048 RepID=A0A6J2XHA6_SITOR|nr:uncharacterized protein LOC115878087 [Sitophilus oryzae]
MNSKKILFVSLVIVVISVVVNCYPAETDSTNGTSKEAEDEVCQLSSQCGWAVYKPFTRDIDYFMKNKCRCPEESKCLRAEDDISLNAFVYRCKKPGE